MGVWGPWKVFSILLMINIPRVAEDDEFPKVAIPLSAVAVHCALELWEKGYITYKSYCEDKAMNLKKRGVCTIVGQDGIVKKTTNFGKAQCERWSDQNCNNVWLVEDRKMQMVVADVRAAADVILVKNHVVKQKLSGEDEAGPSRQA